MFNQFIYHKHDIKKDNFKILIVEDSKSINNALRLKLYNEGYTCYQSFNLSGAIEILNTHNIDLIILDLHLPDGEGEELILDIQNISKKSKIIIFTSESDVSRRDELFRLGILDYIVKGKHINIINKEIIQLIDNLHSNPQYTILLVDDSIVVRSMIKRILLPHQYNIVEASGGKEALEILENQKINLLLLDMQMSDISGLEVLKHIKQKEKYFYLPVFIISSTSSIDVIRSTYKEGCSEYITKPFSPEEIKLKVEQWIRINKNEIELQSRIDVIDKYRNFINEFYAASIFSANGKIKWYNNKFETFITNQNKNIFQVLNSFDKDTIAQILINMRKNQSFQTIIADKNSQQYNMKLFPIKDESGLDFLLTLEILNLT